MFLLEYPVTRRITLPRSVKASLIFIAMVFVTTITIGNIIAVGYELIPLTSTSFNETTSFWYDKFIPTNWRPHSRSCDAATIKLLELISTTGGEWTYTLNTYTDANGNSPIDGLIYENSPLVRCSVEMMSITQPLLASVQNDEFWYECETSAGQFLLLETSFSAASVGLLSAGLSPWQTYPSLPGPSISLNITSAVAQFEVMVLAAEQVLAQPNGESILMPSVVYNNLSSLRVVYYSTVTPRLSLTVGALLEQPLISNSPAGESWTLYLVYVFQNDTKEQVIPISYIPTGEIDIQHTSAADIDQANLLLSPTIELLALASGNTSFDGLRLLNWFFVTYYWCNLYDLGHISPAASTVVQSQEGFNYSFPFMYNSTNNIFENETLFEIYSSYLRHTIIPLLRTAWSNVTLPEFLPLGDDNHLEPFITSISRTYSCSERRIKQWFSLVISVTAADYALIGIAYAFYKFSVGWFQKRKDKRNLLGENVVGG